MGASESKLGFKQAVFKLAEQKNISLQDESWAEFWQLPESADDVFSLFSSSDIRRVRDSSPSNLETLFLVVTSRLFALRLDPEFPHPDLAPERHALNCIRILTRLLPYVYEEERLDAWEDNFFWGSRGTRVKNDHILYDASSDQHASAKEEQEWQEKESLGSKLIDVLIDLLFFAEFTLPKSVKNQKVIYGIWQSGVGCNSPVGTSKEFESNRSEIIRLLLTLSSKAMYMSASVLPMQGVKAITHIVTIANKQIVLTLLCSLLNTALKYNPAAWRVPYDHVITRDSKQTLVAYCLQLLLVLVLYPVPESSDGSPTRNAFRHFLGRLHRAQDFQFLVDGMSRILNQPLQASTTYLPGSQKSFTWAPEMVMLFWELLQCNKRFRSFIVDTDRAHDFMILVLFQANEHKDDPAEQVARMCAFVLQTLSSETSFGRHLNGVFEGQETLPLEIRLPSFRGSYADFLIISLYHLIARGKGKLKIIYPTVLAVINNIAPHVRDLSATSSTKLLQLFGSMASPSFLLANETNHVLLRSLLEAINTILEQQYESNATFVYVVLRAQKRFRALRSLALDSARVELETHTLRRKEAAQTGAGGLYNSSRGISTDERQTPASLYDPSPSKDDAEESDHFAIGDDESSTEEDDRTEIPTDPSLNSKSTSQTSPHSGSIISGATTSQPHGMSSKARGKLPSTHNNSTRSLQSLAHTNSQGHFEPTADWIESWLPELPLHTTLTLFHHSLLVIPVESTRFHTPTSDIPETKTDSFSNGRAARAGIAAIRRGSMPNFAPSYQPGLEEFQIYPFGWSPLSLGWYESLLWGFIFGGELALARSGAGGGANVWKGTRVRLFRVQEAPAPGPSLMAPRGAVDAVGSTLVQRLGGLSLGKANSNLSGATRWKAGAPI